jgi:CubicO group peptidase (beta-lactamase class C family)
MAYGTGNNFYLPGGYRNPFVLRLPTNGSITNQSRRWYPDVPADMYFADGYGGQNIYIIPSKKLVVVRTGLHDIDANEFLKEVIGAVR